MYTETHRFYRYQHQAPKGWESFQVKYRETDLWIRARLKPGARGCAGGFKLPSSTGEYIAAHEDFLSPLCRSRTTLSPLPSSAECSRRPAAAGVGPMASVAGAMAQAVGITLKQFSDSVIVENGGDCYLDLSEETTVGIFAGPDSPFTGKIAIKLGPERFPIGICTSSGTVGHSLSFGKSGCGDRHFTGRGPGRRGRNPAWQHGENPGRYRQSPRTCSPDSHRSKRS